MGRVYLLGSLATSTALVEALLDGEAVLLFNTIMQFESLKVFCDLAETGSFTQTAQVNGVSQSAVSQTISALEKQFKCLFIERSKKNFRLTSDGEVLYNYSKELLKISLQLQQGAAQDLRRHPEPDAGDQARRIRRGPGGHGL
jgi:DNA-binding transcriptional LysR family regulator